MELASLIVAAVGAVGGCAGFLALFMQHKDREARRKVAHYPPELRPVLLEIAAAAGEVASRPRDKAWVAEHLEPLIRRYYPLTKVVASADKNDGGEFALLHAHLVTMRTFSGSEFNSPAETAHDVRVRTDAAAEGVKVAHRLLQRLSPA